MTNNQERNQKELREKVEFFKANKKKINKLSRDLAALPCTFREHDQIAKDVVSAEIDFISAEIDYFEESNDKLLKDIGRLRAKMGDHDSQKRSPIDYNVAEYSIVCSDAFRKWEWKAKMRPKVSFVDGEEIKGTIDVDRTLTEAITESIETISKELERNTQGD